VFCDGVQHCLRFYLDHLHCVKIMAPQFYLQLEKQRSCRGPNQASRVGGGQQSCCISQKFPGEKGCVRQCVLMMQQSAFCRQSSGQSLRTSSCDYCKTSQ
jgi:hypothetical protein